jgi:hypothetical protein
MYVAYKFAGFQEVERAGATAILECDYANLQPFPAYIQVELARRSSAE